MISCLQEVNESIRAKFTLIAQMLGLDESEVEAVLNMSVTDCDPDPSVLIKNSILCGEHKM